MVSSQIIIFFGLMYISEFITLSMKEVPDDSPAHLTQIMLYNGIKAVDYRLPESSCFFNILEFIMLLVLLIIHGQTIIHTEGSP